jgi:hypothetical protein
MVRKGFAIRDRDGKMFYRDARFSHDIDKIPKFFSRKSDAEYRMSDLIRVSEWCEEDWALPLEVIEVTILMEEA